RGDRPENRHADQGGQDDLEDGDSHGLGTQHDDRPAPDRRTARQPDATLEVNDHPAARADPLIAAHGVVAESAAELEALPGLDLEAHDPFDSADARSIRGSMRPSFDTKDTSGDRGLRAILGDVFLRNPGNEETRNSLRDALLEARRGASDRISWFPFFLVSSE